MIRSKWCVCGGSQGYGRREPNAPPAPVPFRPQAADSVGLRPARTDHVAWGLRPARAEGSRGPMDRCTLRRSGAGEEGARAPRPMRREGPHHHAPPRSGPTDWEADRATARKSAAPELPPKVPAAGRHRYHIVVLRTEIRGPGTPGAPADRGAAARPAGACGGDASRTPSAWGTATRRPRSVFRLRRNALCTT